MPKGDSNKVLTGIRIDSDLLKKLKYISWFDRRTFTGVLEISTENYINKWELDNGPITPELIEEAKIK